MLIVSQEPEFAEASCDDLWEFSPDRYEITRGHLTATLVNKGEVLLQSVIITDHVCMTVLIGRC